jgi:acylphosphatase
MDPAAVPGPPIDALASVRLRITGRVQGVYYRANAAEAARRLGLVGRVRNLPDGSVEATAEGPPGSLTAFVAWCHEGPPHARVDQVEATWGPATGQHEEFGIER